MAIATKNDAQTDFNLYMFKTYRISN